MSTVHTAGAVHTVEGHLGRSEALTLLAQVLVDEFV